MPANYNLGKLKDQGRIKLFYFILLIIFIYSILFEFLLHADSIMPRPSIMIESFFSLISHYHLFEHLLFTSSLIYISLAICYFMLYFSSGFLLKLNRNILAKEFLKIFKYFPIIGFSAIAFLWIPSAVFAELLISVLITFILILLKFLDVASCVKGEYIEAAISIKSGNKNILKEITWKSALPSVIRYISKLNFILWALIPLFEAFRNRFGVGLIFRQCYEFRDLSGLFALSIATAIIIILGDLLLKLIQKMLIHWEP